MDFANNLMFLIRLIDLDKCEIPNVFVSIEFKIKKFESTKVNSAFRKHFKATWVLSFQLYCQLKTIFFN